MVGPLFTCQQLGKRWISFGDAAFEVLPHVWGRT
ncbi:hypothetical protein Cadr_000018026 [Camelus dromedarius]|uniref:Uncharacterized protein n=1 Tax=Camelus dromedarius TaxID=9838 RepID=A0A5N4D892_CAMDR|nr:hypothetical protein Cadr_000018026 [Camelus dromedarius]